MSGGGGGSACSAATPVPRDGRERVSRASTAAACASATTPFASPSIASSSASAFAGARTLLEAVRWRSADDQRGCSGGTPLSSLPASHAHDGATEAPVGTASHPLACSTGAPLPVRCLSAGDHCCGRSACCCWLASGSLSHGATALGMRKLDTRALSGRLPMMNPTRQPEDEPDLAPSTIITPDDAPPVLRLCADGAALAVATWLDASRPLKAAEERSPPLPASVLDASSLPPTLSEG